MNDLITRGEAAKILSCEPQTITNYYKRGMINGVVRGERKYLYVNLNDILSLMPKHKAIEEMESNIEAYILERKKEESDMQSELRAKYGSVRVFDTILTILCKCLDTLIDEVGMSDGLKDILSDFVRGASISDISKRVGLSRERVRQKLQVAISLFNSLPLYASKIEECAALRNELALRNAIIAKFDIDINDVKYAEIDPMELEVARIGGLKARALHLCAMMDIITIRQLVDYGAERFSKIRQCGKSTIDNIKNVLLDKFNIEWK